MQQSRVKANYTHYIVYMLCMVDMITKVCVLQKYVFCYQEEKKFFQMELVNRETNFNKVFSASPNVGVLNPLDAKVCELADPIYTVKPVCMVICK